ncbi:GTP 3',8-cyclase MoaA [Lentzea sp. NEAU-D7]|uniref:GTP 3',8-cyclase MoaA n=1 Tax=Lentzea sp. NEAU-D7 TaxID=2994667 RepID=UPI00224B0EB8|nr:GTP 3',8-cyclase MoaA [Lentzea sp. NEAU-D7]MCX2954569.1 GTP 3',8-cyclase MoaA [Lentzea sp. NEAU-D7]
MADQSVNGDVVDKTESDVPLDRLGRPLGDLRISVTDRCNLRCRYCMPEAEYTWLPRADLLTFKEIDVLVDVFVSLGVDKIRLTGGEPLLRRDLPDLVEVLAQKSAVRDLAMTTNGVLLVKHAQALANAGLRRVTVSLDTLRPERFKTLAQRDHHQEVLDGIAEVSALGFVGTKIDTVVMRGTNDDELGNLIEFGRSVPAEVRFIEYMDVGGASGWNSDLVVSKAEMLRSLTDRYGAIEPLVRTAAPASRFRLPDGATFGIVSSTTEPFCSSCNRSRLTADGMWYRCLYALRGTNLREPLRSNASREELRSLVAGTWRARADQGAVIRSRKKDRGALASAEELKADPHLEMHTRGG